MNNNAAFRFILYTFFVAVFLNTCVTSSHILTATAPHLLVPEFSTTESLYIIGLTIVLGIAIFAITCAALYVCALATANMAKTKQFWLLVIAGVIISVVADHFINIPLAKYNDQTNWIALIAAFSILVSLSSQYQFLIGESKSAWQDI
ncbi:hypothetical protein I5907_16470 [Panacibacter sp. DH6]|uniref:Uncharacterized protein n=1 Tax=Panacibacter microcysteis TaxID=2793269 RepID=A0A931EBU9_9BACT|nr:hypothetical protein [Panacibacter microcysteis]MBG9377836.1 hypothetical protein [Panacibacter microcysteis]